MTVPKISTEAKLLQHFSKEELEEMSTEKKEMWIRFFEKGGNIEKLPDHITKEMLDNWRF